MKEQEQQTTNEELNLRVEGIREELTAEQEDYLLESAREEDYFNKWVEYNKGDLITLYCEEFDLTEEYFNEDSQDFLNFCKDYYDEECFKND
jgi:hypothetical protein